MFTQQDRFDQDDENPVVLTQPVFEKFRSMGFVARRNGEWYMDKSRVVICNDHVPESKKPPLWKRLLIYLFV